MGTNLSITQAAPGAGKTIAAITIINDLCKNKSIQRAVIVAPRERVVNQWADDFTKITGRPITRVTGSDQELHGYGLDLCLTWNSVADLKDSFQKVCEDYSTILVCDEHHHAAKDAAWGRGADNAFKEASRIIILTGTPLRSDGNETVWLHN